ncbi:DUF1405 domain-containing protein [Alkalicoccus chagannorensis]|uniref:DUF1405 domain-containing protein n=1 Tax=Alkalicoccus chagannorensis TaxID=427072 RepID=UPI000412128E|nr:DUF1405 domain-containing protein [Alkalicoccus chagannorensis]
MNEYIAKVLLDKPILWTLFLINAAGTIYGYYWYEQQLMQTPWYFLPFVPDSPTASLFFTIVLAGYIFGKQWPLIEALAAVTLIKYGVWAVVMNVSAGVVGGEPISLVSWMLIFSHAGMALQALLYLPFFKLKAWHLICTAVWTIHNDIIDYLFGMHPWVARSLTPYLSEIGYFTFWLSLISLGAVWWGNKAWRPLFQQFAMIDTSKKFD